MTGIVSSMTLLIALSLLFRFSKGATSVIGASAGGTTSIIKSLEGYGAASQG